ncbi:NAD-dependent epimerase/dehydratase family protein [Neomoorella thermoacetica]|uniref:NAD-dependent epimerase/dehydratase family protein n=1 Tax=Neomoorella thermoacetica TaxID=1525 RepID=UPI0030CCB74A
MILVTGGNGFLGSQIAKQLVARGEKVVIFDNAPLSSRLEGIKEKINYSRGDIVDLESIIDVIKEHKVRKIIHLAYFRDIALQEKYPTRAVKVNCTGFNNLLEAARLCDIERVVWASSVAVYGAPELYREPVGEDQLPAPTTLYGACKFFDEYLARQFRKTYGLETVALRPTVIYGEGRWYSGYSNVARDMFYDVVTARKAVVYEGNKRLDWLNVEDAARAFVLAIQAKEIKSDVFNLGGEVATVAAAAAVLKELVPDATIEVVGGGKETWPAALDITRAREELGYQPQYGLREGFARYLEAIRQGVA